MALQGVVEQGLESAYLPALAQLGLKGMVCLPVSKQLDPVLGIDCHVMVPGGPLPNPYIGLLINPRTVMSEKVCKILLRPSPQAWGTPSLRGICDVDFVVLLDFPFPKIWQSSCIRPFCFLLGNRAQEINHGGGRRHRSPHE